jgi:hypothetical protein
LFSGPERAQSIGMKYPIIMRGLLAVLVATWAGALGLGAATEEPRRLKRSESFLGVHYDFHAGKDCTEIGKNTTREMIENFIKQVRPDYVQIDCKGHPGLSSYPTKAGNQAPGFVGDPLRLWRDVTREHGVALYMHYSGVWDTEAVQLHPDWAVVNADGKTNNQITSPFGPYADQLLIPQLRELAGDYRVDGAWVDGECWAALPDYGDAAVQAFRQQTGFQAAPRKRGDQGWYEWMDFHREAYRKYLRHYLTEVNKTHPDFQLCSNWAFTDHMAERVTAPVSFLSGDYSPEDSINSARLSGRYLMRQGKPWDLMAWSFTRKAGQGGSNQKSAAQLQAEAAIVVALGGGFQAYFKQKRDGSIYDDRVPVMAEVAKFCRERQVLCHRSEAIPQVALVLSTAGHYRKINGLFSRDLGAVNGALETLLENQYSVEVLGEHHLQGRLAEYPLVVIPEWDYLEADFVRELQEYARNGGSLLILGGGSAALFKNVLGVNFAGDRASRTFDLVHGGARERVSGQYQVVTPTGKASVFGLLAATNETAQAGAPAATVAPLGKGKIGAVYFDVGQAYGRGHAEMVRQFMGGLVKQLFPNPRVTVAGSPNVDVCLARSRGGRIMVNLVNTSAPHRTEPVFDVIPPVGPLAVTLRVAQRPKTILRHPGGESLPFQYSKGEAKLTVPRLGIHDILVVD